MGKRSRRRRQRERLAKMSAVTTPSFRFQIVKDRILKYPELYLEVFIVGSREEERAFADLFSRARCSRAESPEKADLVVFTGGPDVFPGLYGEEIHPQTQFDHIRDTDDMLVFDQCRTQGIPMFGVCRGAQAIHVFNGGKLYQHVDKHYGDHQIYLTDERRVLYNVSSTHHQMCIANANMKVLADSAAATERWRNPDTADKGHLRDVEAYFYRDICALGVQGHPEYRGYEEYSQWCLQKIEEYIVNCPDAQRVGRYLRINPDLAEVKKLDELV